MASDEDTSVPYIPERPRRRATQVDVSDRQLEKERSKTSGDLPKIPERPLKHATTDEINDLVSNTAKELEEIEAMVQHPSVPSSRPRRVVKDEERVEAEEPKVPSRRPKVVAAKLKSQSPEVEINKGDGSKSQITETETEIEPETVTIESKNVEGEKVGDPTTSAVGIIEPKKIEDSIEHSPDESSSIEQSSTEPKQVPKIPQRPQRPMRKSTSEEVKEPNTVQEEAATSSVNTKLQVSDNEDVVAIKSTDIDSSLTEETTGTADSQDKSNTSQSTTPENSVEVDEDSEGANQELELGSVQSAEKGILDDTKEKSDQSLEKNDSTQINNNYSNESIESTNRNNSVQTLGEEKPTDVSKEVKSEGNEKSNPEVAKKEDDRVSKISEGEDDNERETSELVDAKPSGDDDENEKKPQIPVERPKKRGPPPVPKKPSSRIAAFQEMLQKQQEKQFEKPIPEDDDSNESIPKNEARSKFVNNLNGLFALPGMVPGGVPPPALAKKIQDPQTRPKDDSDRKATSGLSDVRHGRARGPRGRKLPSKVSATEKVEVKEVGNDIEVFTTWRLKIGNTDEKDDYTGDDIDFRDQDNIVESAEKEMEHQEEMEMERELLAMTDGENTNVSSDNGSTPEPEVPETSAVDDSSETPEQGNHVENTELEASVVNGNESQESLE
ncbi:Altered inheritance of mitochondria protein 21 [Nakaseomyces bracarensis]|uniref:Altered inheritance of mitochondria protein 21 n=1 Tax=Nakaseomyces bracarensis TaxID=273131 RepID=A0ABR4NW78_9SACH